MLRAHRNYMDKWGTLIPFILPSLTEYIDEGEIIKFDPVGNK